MARGRVLINMPGEIASSATNGRAVSADGVYDYIRQDNQESINSDIRSRVNTCETSVSQVQEELQHKVFDVSEAAYDTNPTKNSENLVRSGSIYNATRVFTTVHVTNNGEITPNVLHVWEYLTESDELHFILVAGETSVMNEYMIEFTCGDTIPYIEFPNTVRFIDNLELEPYTKYQISIVNNLAIWASWNLNDTE